MAGGWRDDAAEGTNTSMGVSEVSRGVWCRWRLRPYAGTLTPPRGPSAVRVHAYVMRAGRRHRPGLIGRRLLCLAGPVPRTPARSPTVDTPAGHPLDTPVAMTSLSDRGRFCIIIALHTPLSRRAVFVPSQLMRRRLRLLCLRLVSHSTPSHASVYAAIFQNKCTFTLRRQFSLPLLYLYKTAFPLR